MKKMFTTFITVLMAMGIFISPPAFSAQHDLDISQSDANTGITYRAAVNSALQAIATNQSGTGNPGITYPYQIKVDTSTTPNIIYMRKSDNAAWAKSGLIAIDGKWVLDGYLSTTAGGTDTYTATLDPAITSYVSGTYYYLTFTNANTSATPSLNLNALGAKTIKKHGGAALNLNDIAAGHAALVKYDGTDMILLNPAIPNKFLSTTATGTDTYAATLSPAITIYESGMHYFITFTNANTSATPSLNLNALGAKTITKEGLTALVAGDIPANHAAILKYDGTRMILLNPAKPTNAGITPTQQVFTANGTWTRPANCKKIKVTVVGGGGGGAAGDSAANGAGGGGGGAGGAAVKYIDVTSVASVVIGVGTGGAGGATTTASGSAGVATTWGAVFSASGGAGGVNAHPGGVGGIGTSGDYNIAGSAGHSSSPVANGIGSNGGDSFMGGGAKGWAGVGETGGAYGGGGSGGGGGSVYGAGGAGAAGIAIVEEYY